ncbi:hypothetical protein Ngar_c06780 [Candidatus Nitrososphaera gargensis Ga9.2]|uniref:DUF6788 domain-containing protein n=2 Tax=Candidatus Nitrososphaera gargensis TaxID=497727 RepID=K0I8L2_NITGG|nr:hypothetical protein Ngar_c06780 [Candidatus Nitrososphaera gargensis Ga9.2]
MIKEEKVLAEQIKQVQKEVDELFGQYGGSIQVRFIRCGSPNCYCARRTKGHGPYYYLERRVSGKVQMIYLGKNKMDVNHYNNYHCKMSNLKKRLRAMKRRHQQLHGVIMSITQLVKTNFE